MSICLYLCQFHFNLKKKNFMTNLFHDLQCGQNKRWNENEQMKTQLIRHSVAMRVYAVTITLHCPLDWLVHECCDVLLSVSVRGCKN